MPTQTLAPATLSLTPHLVVDNGQAALEFYSKAFGAVVLSRNLTPDGQKLVHGEMRLGNTLVMVCDDFDSECSRSPKRLGGSPVTLNLTVANADTSCEQAIAAGASVVMPVQDTFWGARYGQIRDPFGHVWAFNQQVRDVSPDEIKRGSDSHFG